MTKVKYTFILILGLSMSCNTEHQPATVNTGDEAVMESSHLEGYDPTMVELPTVAIEIQTPGKKMTGMEVRVSNDDSGVTHVQLGENFHLEITEQDMNIDRVIEDLNKDIFYKTTIIEKKEDQLVYSKSLPDGSKSYVHFVYATHINDQPITIRSAKNGLYRKAHIDRMIKSASSVKSLENIALVH